MTSRDLQTPLDNELRAAAKGDRTARDRVFLSLYEDLRRVAHTIRDKDAKTSLLTSDLLHEAYLRYCRQESVEANSSEHFVKFISMHMRRICLDRWRRRVRRRDANVGQEVDLLPDGAKGTDLQGLEKALSELRAHSPRLSDVVDLRFFASRGVEETAALLGVSTATVKRDWRAARAFLSKALRHEGHD